MGSTPVASLFSAIGLSWWLFQTPLFGFPAIDVRALAFITEDAF
jgi:RND superfamily putative drug exporter